MTGLALSPRPFAYGPMDRAAIALEEQLSACPVCQHASRFIATHQGRAGSRQLDVVWQCGGGASVLIAPGGTVTPIRITDCGVVTREALRRVCAAAAGAFTCEDPYAHHGN